MAANKYTLETIKNLPQKEQEKLKKMLLSPAFVNDLKLENPTGKKKPPVGCVCPLCRDAHIVRNGHDKDGTQRYLCKNCGKSFAATTNSVRSGTRKDLAVWEKYIDRLIKGRSVRKTAYICHIHRNTAFLWKHKVLDALRKMNCDMENAEKK